MFGRVCVKLWLCNDGQEGRRDVVQVRQYLLVDCQSARVTCLWHTRLGDIRVHNRQIARHAHQILEVFLRHVTVHDAYVRRGVNPVESIAEIDAADVMFWTLWIPRVRRTSLFRRRTRVEWAYGGVGQRDTADGPVRPALVKTVMHPAGHPINFRASETRQLGIQNKASLEVFVRQILLRERIPVNRVDEVTKWTCQRVNPHPRQILDFRQRLGRVITFVIV